MSSLLVFFFIFVVSYLLVLFPICSVMLVSVSSVFVMSSLLVFLPYLSPIVCCQFFQIFSFTDSTCSMEPFLVSSCCWRSTFSTKSPLTPGHGRLLNVKNTKIIWVFFLDRDPFCQQKAVCWTSVTKYERNSAKSYVGSECELQAGPQPVI